MAAAGKPWIIILDYPGGSEADTMHPSRYLLGAF